jgi:NAD(P)-dependent dehydrogenase (short-subunit alcohol dehydrogenase family)
MKLAGKVALVTGSSQGIGQAIAIRLAQEGANIAINYRSHPEGAKETLSKVKAAGGQCHMVDGLTIQADTGIVSDVQRMIADSVAHFGKLDILVNNAGIEKNADFWNVTEADYDAVMNVNLKGIFFATQAFVKHRLPPFFHQLRAGEGVQLCHPHNELANLGCLVARRALAVVLKFASRLRLFAIDKTLWPQSATFHNVLEDRATTLQFSVSKECHLQMCGGHYLACLFSAFAVVVTVLTSPNVCCLSLLGS